MRNSFVRKVCAIMLAASLLTMTGCGGRRFLMGTGGTSGTYYAFGGVLARYMDNYTDYRVTSVSTSASKTNIQSIGDKDFQICFTQSDVMSHAWEGTGSFEKEGPFRDFRVLGALYAETVQIITMNKEIKSVKDLKGRSVSVGTPGSGTYYNAIEVLSGAGMSLEDITPQYQGFDDSKEALKDGLIDAAFIVAGAPTSAITELATTNGVDLIPIEGEILDKVREKCPYLVPYEIPAGTYPGQTEAVKTITIMATLIVDTDLEEEVVYRLTAAIFDHREEIAGENAKGEELSVTNATDSITVPFHPGAARYYKEHGISVNTLE